MLAPDRSLLVGLLALEQEIISAAHLVEAFRAWRAAPAASLGQILAERGRLTPERLSTLEQLLSDSNAFQEPAQPTLDRSPPTASWLAGSTSIASGDSPTTSLPGSAAAAPTTFSASARTACRYRPVRLHAQGGLGRVYLAEDIELHRQVALKEIHPHAADDRGCRRRFIVEAEITGRLEHPGIVPVYGLGTDRAGRPFYAMRFIAGENLAAAIKRFHAGGKKKFASLEFRQLLARVVSVCNAIGFAHSKGIIHRDLKPHNVMLGPFGETLVVDWGLAKALADATGENTSAATAAAGRNHPEWATAAGEIVGTPAYMSPEQFTGQTARIGTASDIYGLGAILYVLLTGHSPGQGSSTTDLRQAQAPRVTPPRQLEPGVPRALAAICQKAVASRPEDRYPSAVELAADIERWLADEPATAYREPWLERAFRWMRKNRLPVAVASALVLVTALAASVGYVLVRNERDIARYERGQALLANQRAQENAAATRQVVEQFLIQVADDRWSEIPGFEDVRLEMVKLAVERYRALAAQNPSDAGLLSDAAMAYRRCGNLYRMLGRWEESLALQREAVAGYRQLLTGDAVDESVNRHLCEVLCDLGDLTLRCSGPALAEPIYREAAAVGKAARENQQTSIASRQAEARARGDFADVLRRLGRYDEAVEGARAAHLVMQQAARANSHSAVNQISDVYYTVNLAQVLRATKRYGEALEVLNKAQARSQEYREERPRDTNLRYLAAWIRLERSLALQNSHAPGYRWQAELAAASEMLGDLVHAFPRTTSFRLLLAESFLASGRQARALGDMRSAVAYADRALAELRLADPAEPPAAMIQPLLAAAHRLAGEVALAGQDTRSSQDHLLAALSHAHAAREGNPSEPLLADIAEIARFIVLTSR